MKRKHLFELEDQDWFPANLRGYMTDVLMVLCQKMGVHQVLEHEIQRLIEQYHVSKIIDLGSGSGGPMPELLQKLRSKQNTANLELLLTDLYPNAKAIETCFQIEGISYSQTPVDATNLNIVETLHGMKHSDCLLTMINSFHHMPPDVAQNILQSAVQNQKLLFIYELADNKIPFPVWLLMLPLGLLMNVISCLVLTLFVRPIDPKQILFTYLIPIIPICFAWDGQVSYTRIYTFDDIDLLCSGLKTEQYTWIKDDAQNADGKKFGTYILGIPKHLMTEA